IEGWTVVSNSVMVIADPTVAQTGNQYLALINGAITTNIATQPNHKYKINFSYRQAPSLQGLVGWWKGEGNGNDAIAGRNGSPFGGVTYVPGMVNQAFHFNGVNSYIRVPPTLALQFSNAFTLEFWYKAERTNGLEGLVSTRNSEFLGLNYDISLIPTRDLRVI